MPLLRAPTKREIVNYASKVAKNRGLPPSLLVATLDHESIGFDPDVVTGRRTSPAGAIGVGQLMPGTARGLGVDPRNWRQNIQGSADYLKGQIDRFHTPALALSAYNSGPGGTEASGKVEGFEETQGYVKTVLSLQKQYAYLDKGLGRVSQELGVPVKMPVQQEQQGQQGSAITHPFVSPNRVYLDALEGSGPLSRRVRKEAEASGQYTYQAQADDAPVDTSVERQPGEAPGPRDRGKWIMLGSGADRKGVTTGAGILDFGAQVAQVYGHPLTVGTGTNHNRMTVNGRVSAHWSGRAADIPSEGEQLTKLGQSALIAAGVPPRKARTMKGGLYNIGGYQIIFNTNEGGNHWNHLHIGLRGKK